MAITEHFDPAPDASFVRSYDARAARRQLQISLVLVLTLTLAAFALGFFVQLDLPAGEAGPTPQQVHVATMPTPAKG